LNLISNSQHANVFAFRVFHFLSDMNKPDKKEWIDEIVDKYYWVESLSGWLMGFCMFGGFYLLFKDNNSYYGWLLFKISFIFLLITLFYKAIIYLVVYIGIRIKVKKGILIPKDPIRDATHSYIRNKNLH
jgi:hypothetical protein